LDLLHQARRELSLKEGFQNSRMDFDNIIQDFHIIAQLVSLDSSSSISFAMTDATISGVTGFTPMVKAFSTASVR
jgi:hypothetical protein